MNSQIGFRRRLAFAAVLAVLSTSSPVLAENFSNVQGSFNGYGVGIVQGGSLLASDSGSGAASQIGKFTFTMLQIVDLATQSANGSFLLVFPTGDVIFGSLSGAVVPPDPAHIVLNLTIAGGTGRFQYATGTLTFDRHSDFSTLPAYETNSGTVTATITIPTAAK
jgi:hypothetical protein